MRYLKALVLVFVFFVAMIFLFQNQTSLSQTLTFKLDLLFMPAMTSIELPFYFVLLAAFLLGALLCLLLLLWDRMRLSAQIMRANFRVQAMQNEERKLLAQMEKLAAQPREGRMRLFFRKDKKDDKNDDKNGMDANMNEDANVPASEARTAEQPAEPAAAKPTLETTTPENIDSDQATDNLGRSGETRA